MPLHSVCTSTLTSTMLRQWGWGSLTSIHGPLSRYEKLRVAHAPGMPGTFSPLPRISDPDMHHGTCVTHVPWCMPGSLTNGLTLKSVRGKRSRHSRRMRNPQCCVSGKRPMVWRAELHRLLDENIPHIYIYIFPVTQSTTHNYVYLEVVDLLHIRRKFIRVTPWRPGVHVHTTSGTASIYDHAILRWQRCSGLWMRKSIVVAHCGPNDPIRWHKSWSTLASIHFPNQYWLIINRVLWHSHESNFTVGAHIKFQWQETNIQSLWRRRAIIWTNAGILLIRSLGTNFIHFHSRKCIWDRRLQNGNHLVSASMC